MIWTEIGLAEPTRMPVVSWSATARFFLEVGDVVRPIGSPRVLLTPMVLPTMRLPFRFWPGRWAWIVTPARPLPSMVLPVTVLPDTVSCGTSVAMTTPAPPPELLAVPLPVGRLWATRLSRTPAVLCPARMTPQPPELPLATFQETTLWPAGPTSSATRKPPPLLDRATLPVAVDQDEPLRSTPTSPLCSSSLPDTHTCELRATRIASKPACSTVSPVTRAWLVPSTPTPTLPGRVVEPTLSGCWSRASIRAPRSPSRLSGLATTTCSWYVPRQTTTVPPGLVAATALL